MPTFYQWENEDLLLNLYVQPNAKKDELIGEYDGKLKVRISAPPIDNKANKYLLKYLGKTFSVPASRITLIKGENQRCKRVKILNPAQIPQPIQGKTARN